MAKAAGPLGSLAFSIPRRIGREDEYEKALGTGTAWRARPCQRSGWPLAKHNDALFDSSGWQHSLHDHPGSYRHRSLSFSYVREVLCPTLRVGDLVIVDNLAPHKSDPPLRLIKKSGAKVLFLLL